jgi:hypothetical protein
MGRSTGTFLKMIYHEFPEDTGEKNEKPKSKELTSGPDSGTFRMHRKHNA